MYFKAGGMVTNQGSLQGFSLPNVSVILSYVLIQKCNKMVKIVVIFSLKNSKCITANGSSWFVSQVDSVCFQQTEQTSTNQLLHSTFIILKEVYIWKYTNFFSAICSDAFGVFSEKIATILTILLHFQIKTYDKITDKLGKLKP